MTLHIFNPEHDLALASSQLNFTPPHAARQLRADLGYLPALWATEGDAVLVDDADYAAKAYRRLCANIKQKPKWVEWLTRDQLSTPFQAVNPWGWDAPLCHDLLRAGVTQSLLPSLTQLDEIRWLSHRHTAAQLLGCLRHIDDTVGEVEECTSFDHFTAQLSGHRRIVLKAPWSSSGRGVRFLNGGQPTLSLLGWVRRLLCQQGSVMVEPYYDKVKDFGMEFVCDEQGAVHYAGLSLFHTTNGAYTGNILATEQTKREMVSRYIPISLLDSVQKEICRILALMNSGRYVGALGVDMMVVRRDDGKGFLLHPCVEINLRCTMGHVAQALSPTDDDIRRVMRIVIESNYKLKTYKL